MCFLFPHILRNIMSVYTSFNKNGSQVSGRDGNFLLFGVSEENSAMHQVPSLLIICIRKHA